MCSGTSLYRLSTILSMKKFLVVGLLFIIYIYSCGETATTPKETPTSTPLSEKTVADKTSMATTSNKKTIVFFGNSLTAGYGLDPEQGFTSLIEQKIENLGMDYQVVNAGLSGETTAGGNSRVDWILRQPIDVFVLELGGNDGLRGIDPADSMKNLQSIIDKVKTKYPSAKIVLAGMEAPPNMGEKFTSAFREMYPTLAKKNNTALIPFLLDKVGGIPALNQADGIHPTAEGNKIMAETIWKVLEGVL